MWPYPCSNRRRSSDTRRRARATSALELWELLRTYAKQETVDPMKGIGRFLGYGSGGSLLLALGVLFLSLSLLRALQTETDDHLTGNLTWVPYVVTLVITCLLVCAGRPGHRAFRQT